MLFRSCPLSPHLLHLPGLELLLLLLLLHLLLEILQLLDVKLHHEDLLILGPGFLLQLLAHNIFMVQLFLQLGLVLHDFLQGLLVVLFPFEGELLHGLGIESELLQLLELGLEAAVLRCQLGCQVNTLLVEPHDMLLGVHIFLLCLGPLSLHVPDLSLEDGHRVLELLAVFGFRGDLFFELVY